MERFEREQRARSTEPLVQERQEEGEEIRFDQEERRDVEEERQVYEEHGQQEQTIRLVS